METVNVGNVCNHLEIVHIVADQPYSHMYNLQQTLQARVLMGGAGRLPKTEYRGRAQQIITWAHCISDEFFELQDWVEDGVNNSFKEAQMEVIDILCFAFNLGLELDIPGQLLDTSLKDHMWVTHLTLDPFQLLKYHIAIRKQIHHILTLLPWKTWKHYEDYDVTTEMYEEIITRYIDLLKLVFQLAGEFAFTLQDLLNMYVAKNKENHARQDRGY